MKKLIPILLITLFIAGCTSFMQQDTIIGTWKEVNGENYLVFNKDNSIEVLDENKNSQIDVTLKFEAVDELLPHQLYIIAEDENNNGRVPFGIYKIENGKLIIRPVAEYHRTLGGIDMGVSRYEMPKDFSGVVSVYEKI